MVRGGGGEVNAKWMSTLRISPCVVFEFSIRVLKLYINHHMKLLYKNV